MGVLLAARARLKSGTSAGADGLVSEILKEIPWHTLRIIRQSFQAIYDQRVPSPDSWRKLCIQLIPKMKPAKTFDDARAICLLSVMSNWYMACLLIFVEEHGHVNNLATYGFQRNHSVHHMTAPLLHLTQHAALWGKQESLHMCVLDIRKSVL